MAHRPTEMPEFDPGNGPPRQGASERLESWKEIAAYLKREVRTVQRWERSGGLPVHRHQHDERASIFAYKTELDEWWYAGRSRAENENGKGAAREEHVVPASASEGCGEQAYAHAAEAVAEKRTFSGRRGWQLWLVGVGAVAVALAATAIYILRASHAPLLNFHSRDTVLIADFDNRTGDPVLDGTIEYALNRELANSPYVSAAPRVRINDTLALMRKPATTRVDAALGREICLRDRGIRAMVTGRIEKFGVAYALSADLLDPTSGGIVASFDQQANGEAEVLPAVHRLADSLRQALGENLRQIRESDLALERVTTPSLKALQLYSRANDLITVGGCATAFELLNQAITEDPSFASAYILAAYTLTCQDKPASEFMPYARQALELSGRASESERYFIEASYYGWTRRPDQAIAAYAALLQIDPGHVWGANNLEILYRARGDTREAVNTSVQMVKLRPNSFDAQWNAAYSLTTENDSEARPYVDRASAIWSAMNERDRKSNVDSALWLQLYPAYQAWLQDDVSAAKAELTRAEENPIARNGMDDPRDFGLFEMALGRTRRADAWFQEVAAPSDIPVISEANFAMLAYVRGDDAALKRSLRGIAHFKESGAVPVCFMIHEGLLQEARAAIDRHRQSGDLDWLRIGDLLEGELLLAQGRVAEGIPLLQEGLQGTRGTAEPVYFLGAEALASSYLRQGDTTRALRVLEAAAANRRRINYTTIFMAGSTLWMRDELELAHLYRRLGRIQDAARIEAELRKLLAYADPDFPMLVELDRVQEADATARNAR